MSTQIDRLVIGAPADYRFQSLLAVAKDAARGYFGPAVKDRALEALKLSGEPEPAAAEMPDPAAIYSIALSLHEAVKGLDDIGDTYSGCDGFTREAMILADRFETWCCANVDWNVGIDDVWAYFLESNFAKDFQAAGGDFYALSSATDDDFNAIARRMELPIKS